MCRTMVLSFCIAMATIAFGQSPQSAAPREQAVTYAKDTTFAVLVTWDDAYKTPTTGAYIEAHSFNVNWVSEKSFVLKMVKPLGVTWEAGLVSFGFIFKAIATAGGVALDAVELA